MALGEFELIEKYFTRPARRAVLGVGDDCALLAPAAGMQLCVSSDMLVEGRHFLSTVNPQRLGHKALAVNLSDLAACGARPLAFTLALALPRADEAFLAPFAAGLWALAERYALDLVGGDTTAGPLNICITAFGEVPAGQALLRSGARAGDEVWVSGTLGDARAALECFRGTLRVGGDGDVDGPAPGADDAAVADAVAGNVAGAATAAFGGDPMAGETVAGQSFDRLRLAMEMPEPRVTLGLQLRGIASSAIDLSDGLLGDLGHVLRRSGVGARLQLDALPRSEWLSSLPPSVQRICLLQGGDDYELLFTAAPSRHDAVRAAARAAGVAVSRVGRIEAGSALVVMDGSGQALQVGTTGFDHFRS